MATNQNTYENLLSKSTNSSILESITDSNLIELHQICKSQNSVSSFMDRRRREWLPLVENEIRFRQNELKKSKENDLEKGGEGSRGGKIIGHTQSGKPIYDSHNHHSHVNFTSQDHLDAVKTHNKKSKEYRHYSEEAKNHIKQAQEHDMSSQALPGSRQLSKFDKEPVTKSEESDLSQQDINDLEKGGKRAQHGEKRTWGGIEYTKTHDGWQPIVSAEHHSEKAKEHHLKALDAGKKGDTKAELHHLDKHVYHSKLRDLAKQTSTVDTEKDKTPRERYEELGKKLESGEITEQEFLNEQSRLRYETGLSLAELSGEDQILVNSSESKAQELGTKYPALEDAVGLSDREWTLDKVTNITVTPKGNYSIEVNGKDSGIIIAADSLAGIQAKQMMSTDYAMK